MNKQKGKREAGRGRVSCTIPTVQHLDIIHIMLFARGREGGGMEGG